MISIRSVARSGARVAPRIATGASPRVTIARPALRATAAGLISKSSAFSTSALLRKSETAVTNAAEVDSELSAKLQTELQFENEVKEDSVPVPIKEYLDSGLFKVTDTPGKDEVILSRDYGEEKITVTFSIADLANYEAENDMFDEDNLDDEEFNEGSGQRSAQDAEEGDGEDESPEQRPPVRLHVVIEKPGKAQGALNVEATSADEGIMIESVYFYKDAKLAHTPSPEAEFASQEVYPGPAFSSLDEDLQILMERFLEERGINESLAVFASEYMEYKEQKEYVSWLSGVKQFIDA